jgi:septal ring factor EnvC (AmiA/AmiB activator)
LNIFVLELAFCLTEFLAKRPSIDEISAKLQVLESEHESLQQSLKESHEDEYKLKKELEDKHAQEMSEMAEKLKNSNNRVKTLASKLKVVEAEATNIDKMIFRKDFTIPACILYSSLPNP